MRFSLHPVIPSVAEESRGNERGSLTIPTPLFQTWQNFIRHTFSTPHRRTTEGIFLLLRAGT